MIADYVRRWFQTANPLSKTLMGISITTSVVLVYRLWYAPYSKRQRYRQAEEWANMIIEQEEKEEAERGSTNLSY